MSHVYVMEHIAAKIRASRELRKKGKDQVSAILFLSVPEVEVIERHRSQSSIAQSQDLLDERRARIQFRSHEKEMHEKDLTKGRFSRIPLYTSFVRKGNRERLNDVRFPWIHKSDPVDFHSSK